MAPFLLAADLDPDLVLFLAGDLELALPALAPFFLAGELDPDLVLFLAGDLDEVLFLAGDLDPDLDEVLFLAPEDFAPFMATESSWNKK